MVAGVAEARGVPLAVVVVGGEDAGVEAVEELFEVDGADGEDREALDGCVAEGGFPRVVELGLLELRLGGRWAMGGLGLTMVAPVPMPVEM